MRHKAAPCNPHPLSMHGQHRYTRRWYVGSAPHTRLHRSSVHAAVRLATRAVQLVTMTATLRVEPRPPRPRTVVSDTQADLQ